MATPPHNLPIHALDADVWEDDRPEEIARQQAFKRKLQFASAYALVAALLLASVIQGHGEVAHRAEEIQESAFLSAAGGTVQEYTQWLSGVVWRK